MWTEWVKREARSAYFEVGRVKRSYLRRQPRGMYELDDSAPQIAETHTLACTCARAQRSCAIFELSPRFLSFTQTSYSSSSDGTTKSSSPNSTGLTSRGLEGRPERKRDVFFGSARLSEEGTAAELGGTAEEDL